MDCLERLLWKMCIITICIEIDRLLIKSMQKKLFIHCLQTEQSSQIDFEYGLLTVFVLLTFDCC